MSISHRTNRLKLVGQPSVEQLQNGRYRLTVNCTALNTRNDWYSANKDRIFPDYGSLQSAEMSIDGLAPRAGEAYADMRLTKVESGNRSMRDGGDYLVVLTYETAGSTFVQVKDDNTDYELNGLRRVTRTSIAETGTDYVGTVGTSYIDHQIDSETAVRCYLASYGIDDTDSFRQVQEVYVEAGTLSETLDNVGSQKAKVIETIGADPATPDGYVLANTQVSDFEGIKTNRYTFLKPSVLSRNVDTRNNGKLKVETVEAFSETPTSTIGGVQISIRQSDVEGIPTNQYVFALGFGEVERSSQTKNQGALTITTVTSLGFPGIATGIEIEATTREEDGYILFRNTFADGNGEVSRTVETRNQGALTVTTVEALGAAGTGTGVEIEATTREQDGYTLFRNTFATGDGEVSRTIEYRNQGKLTITTVESLGSAGTGAGVEVEATTREQDGYTLFRNVFADGQGEVSRTVENRNQGKLTVTTVEALGTAGSAIGVGIEATTREQDGYTLFRNVFADGQGEVSRSTEYRNQGKLTVTTIESLGSAGTGTGVEIEATTREQDGYTLFRNTFAQGNGEVSRSTETRNQGKLTITTVEALGSAGSAGGVEIEATTREQDGYTLFRNVFADGQGEVSRTTETRNQGKLTVTTIESLGSAGTGTGVEIEATTREQDGYTLFRNTFAEGNGEVSRTVETRNQGKLTITTVEALGTAGTGTGVEIEATTREQDGYTLFRNTFAEGQGEVSRTVETKNQGKLTITTVESLGSAGTGAGVEVEATTREQDGYTLFRNVFANGTGVISAKTDKQYQDTLQIVTTTALGVASGIDNISSSSREEDGYTIFTNVGATGDGEISNSTEERNQGKLKINRIVSVGTPPTPVGTIISRSERKSDGHTVYDYSGALGEGQIFISQSAGPNNIPGTTQRTIRSLGAELIPDGVLIDSQDIVRDGYIEYIRTTLDGAIEGVKTVYADVATVEVPGTVACTTQAVSEGDVSGTIAITNSTPRRQKQVQTQVTIEITTTPPASASRAYDLGAISCSVTSVQTKLQSGDGSVATAVDGNTTLSQVGYQKSFASSANVQNYVGSYLTSSSSSGSVFYQSSEQPYLSAPNAISVQTAFSSSSSSCTGTGATAATGYSEVGVISRTVNAVLSALDGTTYYQVVTEETI